MDIIKFHWTPRVIPPFVCCRGYVVSGYLENCGLEDSPRLIDVTLSRRTFRVCTGPNCSNMCRSLVSSQVLGIWPTNILMLSASGWSLIDSGLFEPTSSTSVLMEMLKRLGNGRETMSLLYKSNRIKVKLKKNTSNQNRWLRLIIGSILWGNNSSVPYAWPDFYPLLNCHMRLNKVSIFFLVFVKFKWVT